MDLLMTSLNAIPWEKIMGTMLRIALILIITWVTLAVLKKLLHKLEDRLIRRGQAEGEPPSESAKRVETLVRLVRQGSYLTLWITVGLLILKEVGIDVGPVLAGAGIVGLAVGFGAQNLVRDVISGFFFILENQVRVGDVAVVNGTGGVVEQMNFRTIVLRDVSGVVHIFPNGTVTTLSNMTLEWSAYVFDIGVAYKENTDRVVAAIKDVCAGMQQDPAFGPNILEPPEIFGVDRLADSSVTIKGRIKTRPSRQWIVGREFLRRIKIAFDEQGIEIPYPHRTLYFGEPSEAKLLEKMAKGGEEEREREK